MKYIIYPSIIVAVLRRKRQITETALVQRVVVHVISRLVIGLFGIAVLMRRTTGFFAVQAQMW